MTCIVANQKKKEAIEAGTAFRYAYDCAKTWKALIWWITFSLAIAQIVLSLCDLFGMQTPIQPIYLTTFAILTLVVVSTIGKYFVTKWQSLGCTLQRMHDYLTLGVGIKPSHIEIPKSYVIELSKKRLKAEPNDDKTLETWWPKNLTKVPYPVAKIISTYSTFAWESELRKRYQCILNYLMLLCLTIPIAVAIALDFTVLESVIYTIAPFTPIIAVVLDEWFVNKETLKIAEQLTQECHSTWNATLKGKLDESEMNSSTEEHMRYWQNYRQSATPIFEWLYKVSRNRMEMNMIIDVENLITDFKNRL